MRAARAVGIAVAVHLGRFVVLIAATVFAPVLGLRGWDVGLFANVACCVYAVVLMSVAGLWRSSGALAPWRSWAALLWLVPLVAEAASWLIPDGVAARDGVGYGLWALSFLLVGINEELTSRGVVLSVLRRALHPVAAVVVTAVLFGLQHLSLLVTTGIPASDVIWVVGYTAVFGFALAAYQARFAWLWPLIVVHAASDFTSVLSPGTLPDPVRVAATLVLVAAGCALLAVPRRRPDDAG
jgi:membrane protease YdiL (CAAX protease family)